MTLPPPPPQPPLGKENAICPPASRDSHPHTHPRAPAPSPSRTQPPRGRKEGSWDRRAGGRQVSEGCLLSPPRVPSPRRSQCSERQQPASSWDVFPAPPPGERPRPRAIWNRTSLGDKLFLPSSAPLRCARPPGASSQSIPAAPACFQPPALGQFESKKGGLFIRSPPSPPSPPRCHR